MMSKMEDCADALSFLADAIIGITVQIDQYEAGLVYDSSRDTDWLIRAKPDTFNTNQGSQFTSNDFTAVSRAALIAGVDWAGVAMTSLHVSQTSARISFTTPLPSLKGTSL